MSLNEHDVTSAVDTLRARNLAWQLNTAGGRVPKFEHNLPARFSFTKQELAIVTVLLLRGPLTVGEIRGCTGRMYAFKDLQDVDDTCKRLGELDQGPFVVKLPREAGRKENRFAHLFCGEVKVAEEKDAYTVLPPDVALQPGMGDRIITLELRVEKLTTELEGLRKEFGDFKKAFE